MAKRKETSTNHMNREFINDECGIAYAIDIMAGRWKLKILYKLEKKKLRFRELKERIPNITDRMLTLHLQELEADGLISRTVYAEVPPRVEYQLTESALLLLPVWDQMNDWGHQHREKQRQAADMLVKSAS
jgi:DNA-binding HxlR family transcriptional regulator